MNNDSALTQEMAITEHVQQALRANTTTARYPIEVAVQGATVSLHGTVDSQETKDTAEQLARNVPGVVAVANELAIEAVR
jgi:osmotically-inducible protein OsmY